MVATECVATGVDWMAGATTWGRMMRRIRNQGGSKRGDENRHRAGVGMPRTNQYVMTIVRITTGINKAADAGRMDAQIRSTDALRRVSQTTATSSRISWLGPSGGNREPAALIVVWQMCYPVQPPAHPIQLADVAPPEAVQERPQGGWRLDRAAQGPGSVPRCATRRRRQCSRPQPARRPPGSASCLPCSPAPAHLRGQRGCRRVHADLN